MKARTARVARDTLETQIEVTVNLDGTGMATLASGIPFLDHMLDQVARHGLIDLDASKRPATCRSIRTTRSKTSASRSARRWRRRSATRKG